MKTRFMVVSGLAAAQLLMIAGCKTEVLKERECVGAAVPPGTPTAAPKADVSYIPPAAPALPPPAPPKADVTAPRSFPRMESLPDTPKPTNARSGRRTGKNAAVRDAAKGGAAGTYVVRRGDYPAKIAAAHHIRLQALMAANNLTPEAAKQLKVGQKLVIPGGKAVAPDKAPATRSAAKNTAPKGGSAVAAADGLYTVQAGDFPAKIAKKFKVSTDDLLAVNNLTPATARQLKIGQKLRIPDGKTTAANASAVTADTAEKPAATGVAKTAETDAPDIEIPGGDAPAAKAPAAGTDVVVDNTVSVSPVAVPVDISVEDFAKQNGITIERLRELNKDEMPRSGKFKAGDMVFLPEKR